MYVIHVCKSIITDVILVAQNWGGGGSPLLLLLDPPPPLLASLRLDDSDSAPSHLRDVPPFFRPCQKRWARLPEGREQKTISSTCHPFPDHLKGWHVAEMQTKRVARS